MVLSLMAKFSSCRAACFIFKLCNTNMPQCFLLPHSLVLHHVFISFQLPTSKSFIHVIFSPSFLHESSAISASLGGLLTPQKYLTASHFLRYVFQPMRTGLASSGNLPPTIMTSDLEFTLSGRRTPAM